MVALRVIPPDRTYRGNRAMTRYEFAAGLNACMDRVNELIAASTSNLVKKEDLATLQKLQEEFSAELATLRGRVDALEAKTATLEKQQFSTTTKLNGEVIFALAGVASGKNVTTGEKISKNVVLGDRIRLNFDTTFTGKDLLRTRLQASNLDSFSNTLTGTREGDLRLAGTSNNQVGIDALLYQFPLGKQTTVVVEANAGAIDDFTNTINPYLDGDGGSGALSHFGTRNSIYYLLGGTGVGVKHDFSDHLQLSAGYLASNAASPDPKAGLFNGPYGTILQVTATPSEALALGLTYVHSYNTDFTAAGSVGSNRSNLRSLTNFATRSDAFGAEASYQISPKVVLNGSLGYTNSHALSETKGNVNIWNWAIGLAFPDLGYKGNLAGLVVGMEPKVTGGSSTLLAAIGGKDKDTSLHVEGFYQYQINDHLSVTPSLIWLTAPDHNSSNGGELIGTIRSTFTF